jgi:hypothetical protein
MFWGVYSVLWYIVVGLVVTSVLLLRMGIHLFNREELLGRELDVLNLGWVSGVVRREFTAGAGGIRQWYAGLFRRLPRLAPALGLTALVMAAGYAIGLWAAGRWTLPAELFSLTVAPDVVRGNLQELGFLQPEGWVWVMGNNVRAVLLASLLGAFTFGVLGLVLLMAPVLIVGYFAGNVALAGGSAGAVLGALVLPHALVEIPAAMLAGAAIVRWGMVVVSPARGRSLGHHWLAGFAEWARLMVGLVVPLLAVAALIEVFVTPQIALRVLFGG